MRRWIPVVLVVIALSTIFVVTNKRENEAVIVGEPETGPAPRPESTRSESSAAPISSTSISAPEPAKLTDDDFLNRQKPVPGKLLEVMAELAPRAEAGDAAAAFQLYVKINDCKSALEGSTSARKTIDEAENAAEKARLINAMAKLESCEGITEELIDSRTKWLTLAADRGDPLAQLTYASSVSLIVGDASQMMANPRAVEDFKKKSLNFLEALADRGEVSAILRLCNAYTVGVLVPQDHVKAYAYAYLANLITGRSQDLVQTLGVNLTNEQIQRGQQIAISLHRRCCS